MRTFLPCLLLLCMLGLAPAVATARPPPVVTSAAPDRVSITVYRSPWGVRGAEIDLTRLAGFALVTETRTIRLPKGPAELRFEGVADSINPASAIIHGLPGGTVEKNRDARLLSPASLVDGSLGRFVSLVRTDPATGQLRRDRAKIVARSLPGIVLQTDGGFETLRCSGLAETLHFDEVPADLSAKPVLSVSTVTPTERTITVTLSYLAHEFDWNASYVVTLAPDGRSLDLFAWLTLANGNPEQFADAQVLVVAGRVNRPHRWYLEGDTPELRLQCYPLGTTTSNLPSGTNLTIISKEDIEATGATTVTQLLATIPGLGNFNALPSNFAELEGLGDLKLYRVPEPVTVAPGSQKQVALLSREGVRFQRFYCLTVNPNRPISAEPAQIFLKLHNVQEDGLGLPLPAGTTALYANYQGERLLLGDGRMSDHAVGETLRIGAGFSSQVLVDQKSESDRNFSVTVTNSNAFAVTVEVPVDVGGGRKILAQGLMLVDGLPTWTATIPANGRAGFAYRIKGAEER